MYQELYFSLTFFRVFHFYIFAKQQNSPTPSYCCIFNGKCCFLMMCFCVIFCVIKSLFLSVLVMYTRVKVDKAVINSLWPHVFRKIYVCNSRTFPITCNLCPTLSLNDRFFSDLLNCAHIVKFGVKYLTCNGLCADCMGTSHVGHFPVGGVRKYGAVRYIVVLALLISHIL